MFNKKNKYVIAIDSDGCVMDSMTIKHQKCFFPMLLKHFKINVDKKNAYDYWQDINLNYPSRGINRFIGLSKFLEKFANPVEIEKYLLWIENSPVHNIESLESEYKKSKDNIMKQAILWSSEVNICIDNLELPQIFEGASDIIKNSSKVADIVVISSANTSALNEEWKQDGLCDVVKEIMGQERGSKKDCIRMLIDAGYDADKILVIGDAYGDYNAAKANGVHYYKIEYNNEVSCWKLFDSLYREQFLNGTYNYSGKEILDIALEDAQNIIKCNVDEYTDRFQHVSVDGVYPKEENKLWTMSFYPGQLYLMYELTNDKQYIRNKKSILNSFKQRCDTGHMQTHDIGFLFQLTAYYDYKMTGDEKSLELMIDAADKLMLRYKPIGGYIQAWGPLDSDEEKTRIIIDTMMNLKFLFLASSLTGDDKYKKAAESHARYSSKTLVRKDYSTYHTYWVDILTGKALYGATHQGHADESTWARGQAWSLYGFTTCYKWTKDPYFLKIARECADVFLKNLPPNDTCYWDFDFTDANPDIKDTSAASTACSGLITLHDLLEENPEVKDYDGKYLVAAKNQLEILANRYQNNKPSIGSGLLKEGMYHRDNGAREYTSWGDYYFLEAILKSIQK